ncbi:hypothetical protein CFter6_0520 [Collimonas fungivorans]|uniref:Uncharacterized protein n=1 Tax=Collimonas fungivorans TaxID=158899 RepID=A0A127P600_9BURK|nr:hypothetical protein CFter6_0520 [Collimonas fungivorans]
MTDFVKKLSHDLSSHAGLGFIGRYLKGVNISVLIRPTCCARALPTAIF